MKTRTPRLNGYLGLALFFGAPVATGLVRAGAAPSPASPVPAAVDAAFFTREVRPVLERSCLGCHGAGARLSGLDLRSRASALKGGVRGAALVPGKAEKSLLYAFMSGHRSPQMPPAGKLAPAEVATFKRWLDGGAPWPDGTLDTAHEQVWWSFKAPVLPPVPQLPHSEWAKNDIDRFVLKRLREEGLTPSPAAPRRVLIRRAYMDLTGLPPTPEEVRAFEQDTAPDAWEKVVDRLLASPHYGERWARHWLDLVRYADSSGFEGDKDRPLAWKYRDYVVDSFNRDKPYNQFLREQLAGDEIRPGDPEALIATGYLACGPEDQVQHNEKTRADELDDLVSTTGASLLGLTLGCARCHDHKYDPVKQSDYYRMQAIFAPTQRREVDVPTAEERRAADARNRELDAELAPLLARLEPLRQHGMELARASGNAKPNDDQLAAALPEPERKQFTDLRNAVQAVQAKRPQLPRALTVTDQGREFAPVHLLLRGDAYHPGPVVQPGFLTSLPDGATDVTPAAATPQTTGRRRALADWIVSPKNPLTARVWVNRVWRQHFSRGLVASVSNFGINGELPSHPELLDYLAVRFTEGIGSRVSGIAANPRDGDQTAVARSGSKPYPLHPIPWSLKPLHRMILLSATYQQSSVIRPEAQAKDPLNRMLWRMPVRRLEAEAIRDSLLTVAGSMNLEMGGPPVYPPVDPTLRADTFLGYNWPVGEDNSKTWRRSIYIKVKRSLIYPQLDVFDCPEITAAVAQRNVTTTPTQALTLLNDPLVLRQSGLFAERVAKEAGADPKKQITRAYELALGRAPTQRELALGLEFLKKNTEGKTALADFCHAVINLNEFVYVP